MRVITKALLTITLLFPYAAGMAADEQQISIIPRYDMTQYDNQLTNIYSNIPKRSNALAKLEYFSQAFLSQPYMLGALGEGPEGEFDKNPLYRTDGFDCLTYVSTVIALINAKNLDQFKHNLESINYKEGKVSYQNRNHFTSVDWNVNNQNQGYIKDITTTILDSSGKSVYQIANAYINKKAWYEKKTLSDIKLFDPISPKNQKALLNRFRDVSKVVVNEESHLPYIPLSILFDGEGRFNQSIANQIPSGSIIEIVRPNWDLESLIGTHLNISHLGFALRTKEGLVYREASSIEKKIIDISLEEYLRNYLTSSTVKGINIHEVLERKGGNHA